MGSHGSAPVPPRPATVEVRLLDRSRCRVEHPRTGAVLETDAAPEYGGGGTGFSSTDLVAAALGSCIGSSLAPILLREELDLEGVVVRVEKELAASPRRIAALAVVVTLPAVATEQQRRKLRNAARTCAVHRSLGSDVEVRIELA